MGQVDKIRQFYIPWIQAFRRGGKTWLQNIRRQLQLDSRELLYFQFAS